MHYLKILITFLSMENLLNCKSQGALEGSDDPAVFVSLCFYILKHCLRFCMLVAYQIKLSENALGSMKNLLTLQAPSLREDFGHTMLNSISPGN